MNAGSLRLPADSLATRIAAILIAGLLAAQAVSLWLQWNERAEVVAQTRGQYFADRLAEAVRQLEAVPRTQRALAAAVGDSGLSATPIGDADIFPHTPRGAIVAVLADRLGSPREIRSPGGQGMQRGNASRIVDVRLADGQWIRLATTRDPGPPAWPSDLLTRLLIALGGAIVATALAVRLATRPLRALAEAADALGHDLDAPPLAETGPAETRHAARAFNRMQEKIRRLIAERARALAAVSHDLRTPLTRLRLRAELIDDETLRKQMTNDLNTMAAMLDSTLDYLRNLHDNEPLRRIDMNALLSSLADDYAENDVPIEIEGVAHAPYSGRLSALRRALQNLIDNAVRYGRRVSVRIKDDETCLRIAVDDDGPGLLPEQRTRAVEPYARGLHPNDATSNTNGIGLGLSITHDIALLHGGELQLDRSPEGGLSATLILPRAGKTPPEDA